MYIHMLLHIHHIIYIYICIFLRNSLVCYSVASESSKNYRSPHGQSRSFNKNLFSTKVEQHLAPARLTRATCIGDPARLQQKANGGLWVWASAIHASPVHPLSQTNNNLFLNFHPNGSMSHLPKSPNVDTQKPPILEAVLATSHIGSCIGTIVLLCYHYCYPHHK